MSNLTLYERFVLIVQSKSLKEAKALAGDNILLQQAIDYLVNSYHLYKKTQS